MTERHKFGSQTQTVETERQRQIYIQRDRVMQKERW